MKSASGLIATAMLALLLAGCGAGAGDGAPDAAEQAEDIQALDAVVDDATTEGPVQASAKPVAAPVEFPTQFLGNWDYDSEGCGEGESGTKFRITDDQIIGYEETSTLKSIQEVDDLVIHVVLETQSADGVALVRQTMRLSPVAGITMRIQTGDKTIRALRCDPV